MTTKEQDLTIQDLEQEIQQEKYLYGGAAKLNKYFSYPYWTKEELDQQIVHVNEGIDVLRKEAREKGMNIGKYLMDNPDKATTWMSLYASGTSALFESMRRK